MKNGDFPVRDVNVYQRVELVRWCAHFLPGFPMSGMTPGRSFSWFLWSKQWSWATEVFKNSLLCNCLTISKDAFYRPLFSIKLTYFSIYMEATICYNMSLPDAVTVSKPADWNCRILQDYQELWASLSVGSRTERILDKWNGEILSRALQEAALPFS